jgi:hypothetical protein
MNVPNPTAKNTPRPEYSSARVVGIPALISLFSFFYYFRQNDLLLYGDAVAHLNIARRVFDSQTPGLLQLGTVWLPLPHLLMIPFIVSKAMWQSGAGASIPSMIAYVFGVAGIFRLVRDALSEKAKTNVVTGRRPVPVEANHTNSAAIIGAWTAAIVYGANPNLIYMQATAMTESVYLAFFIWAVVYFVEFVRGLPADYLSKPSTEKKFRAQISVPPLTRSAWCLAAAELTRYDGWFLAGVMGGAVAVIALRRWQHRKLRRALLKFMLGIAIAPILWLLYNAVIYGNALEFANGPYSAKAIEQRVGAPNPALHSATVAAIYFLKSAQLNMAVANWGRFWLAAALAALALALWKRRSQAASILLLWIPLPFYSYSIAYGSVPLHVYTWWPFATFNQRYGLQLLPVFAVSVGLLAASVFAADKTHWRGALAAATMIALVALSYASVWKAGPQCFQEARRNWDIRAPLNAAVERVVTGLPPNSRFLMDLGEHVGVMEQAGIPLRRVVNNENHRAWERPTDPEGLWERALADPPRYVDFVIAFDGDVVDQQVNRAHLTELVELHAMGQPHAHIYVPAAPSTPNQSR